MTGKPSLWVFVNTYFRWLWGPLALDLAARTGLAPVLIVVSAQDAAFYRRQLGTGFAGDIVVQRDLYAIPFEGGLPGMDAAATYRRAAEIERAYGVSMMRDLILSDRHLGRAFHHNGSGHPVSRLSRRASPVDALQICVAAFDEAERIARDHPPALMVSYSGGGGIYGKPMTEVGRRQGAHLRALTLSRFGDCFIWADDEYENTQGFAEFFRDYPAPSEDEIAEVQDLVRPTGMYTAYVQALPRDLAWARIAYLCAREAAKQVYHRLRGYRKARIGYFAWSNMGYYVRQRLDWNRLRRPQMKTLADLDSLRERKIVYYPLQTDPESSIYIQSPEHSDQFATVRELALSLPADAVLAVKEHVVELGRRPRQFYDWIERMPNVVHLRPDVPGLEITARADLVATINSSAGYEAAALGKPVIHFSSHGRLLALPHVHHIASFRDLGIVREILADLDPAAEARRRRDGARFYLALRAYGLDMSAMKVHGRKDGPSAEELELLSESLLATLPALDGSRAARA